jgi:nuclear transport factor 2 (NTF2) superfamily protein
MSEKYSTDELVNYLLPAEGLGVRLLLPPEVSDAIISRLRAADKLCGAAKVTLAYLDDHFWENANIDESMTGERILTPLEKELKKAIADYEGKEEA